MTVCLICGLSKTKIKKKNVKTLSGITICYYEEWYNFGNGKICHKCYTRESRIKLSKEEYKERHKHIPQWQKGKLHPFFGRKLTDEHKRKIGITQKGSKHWNWKGGRKLTSSGYVQLKAEQHPHKNNQGYVREHILIMEKHLGRYLAKDEVVHHKNGIRQDNRLENLQLMTKKEHDSLKHN